NVSEYINSELLKDTNTNPTVCDLSCGSGEFLVSALKKLKNIFSDKSLIQIIENNLYGVDILEENVFCTKLFLSLYVLTKNEDTDKINFNIIKADSTRDDILTIFDHSNIQKGFDFIVGNPP